MLLKFGKGISQNLEFEKTINKFNPEIKIFYTKYKLTNLGDIINRKAKIIATIGPSTTDFKSIKILYYNVADIFRLNFSHDVKDSHIKRFKDIRNLEKKVNRPIGILMDLQGPKLRVGKFDNGPIFLKQGKKFTFGQMKPSAKYKIDHRMMAFNKIKKFL